MNSIELKSLLPKVFASQSITSQVWLSDLIFQRGKRYLVKAKSGAGKSSLCSFIMGYRRDFDGAILFDGVSTREMSVEQWAVVRQSSISYLPQGLMLFDELTAKENIMLKNSLTDNRSREWVESALQSMELDTRANTLAAHLSYGQKQRVAAIRALCQPFDYLLLDEPVSHLDKQSAELMARFIDEQAQLRGSAIIATSIGQSLSVEYDTILSL